MAFYGSSFVFDGVPSEQYGLIMASFNRNGQTDGNIGGKYEIHEERINRRSTGLHYGVTSNTPLSFPIVLTVCEDNRYLDRSDVAAIAGWLTGHNQYKQLAICQPDMEGIYYRCIITELKEVQARGHIVGFNATMTCDGPYAYRSWPATICVPGKDVLYRNMSNVNGYYRPVMSVVCNGSAFSFENKTDGTKFMLSGMPAGKRVITIDAVNQVMTSSDGINLYQYWNVGETKHFPRFVRGDNVVSVVGGTVTIVNEFPWNVGY